MVLDAEVGRFCEICKLEKRQSCVKLNEKWVCATCLDGAKTVLLTKAKPYKRYTVVEIKRSGSLADMLFGNSEGKIISLEEDGVEWFSGHLCDETRQKLNAICDALNFYEAHKNGV